MSASASTSLLRRYTSLPSLIHVLQTEGITLLDPKSWDDTNDSYCMSVYREKRELKTLLALCFTETAETYHHWRVFAGDSSGVCVFFNKERLLQAFSKSLGYKAGPVEYKTLPDMRAETPFVAELPFIKRAGYQDECEFRVIYQSKTRMLKGGFNSQVQRP